MPLDETPTFTLKPTAQTGALAPDQARMTPEQLATLMKLTERYCVVYQTLRAPPPIAVTSRMA